MEQLIYAFSSSITDIQSMVLVESIRNFGGELSDCPIWIFTLKNLEKIPKDIMKKLNNYEVQVHTLDLDSAIANFPFISHVYAAKKAEDLALNKAKHLAFLGTNTVVAKPPFEFILEDGVSFAYRPVHHKLIGSNYNEPIDKFWKLIYEKTNVKEKNIFPLRTHVDGNILRPYINSGHLVVKPKRGFFNQWWKFYLSLHNDPVFKEFYEKNDLYLTFIHQAVLSGVFLSYLDKSEIYELPLEYNYPINLYHEIPDEFLLKNLDELVTFRYYLEFIEKPEDYEKIPFKEPLKSWFSSKIH